MTSPAEDKNKQKCILNSQIAARKSQLSLMTNRLISACEPWHQATLEKIQDTGGKKEKAKRTNKYLKSVTRNSINTKNIPALV